MKRGAGMKRIGMYLLLLLLAFGAVADARAQEAEVAREDIEKTVFGSGVILPVNQPGVYAEISGRVARTLVGMGDSVKAGDVLVELENADLAGEIRQLEYDIEMARQDVLFTESHTQYVYRQLYDEDGDKRFNVNTGEPLLGKFSNEISVYAPCDGRVMAVKIEPGDDALAKFREHGYVIMLSTDGRMRVNIEEITGADVAVGEELRVAGEGVETTGKVISLTRHNTSASVLVESDAYAMDTPVSVSTMDGEYVGSGILEINKPMGVSAYGGTIKSLAWNAAVGRHVKRLDPLARIVWDEIPLHINNDTVLREFVKVKIRLEKARANLEALAVVAPCDGKIVSVDVKKGDKVEDGAKLLSMVESGAGMALTLSVDELDIISVQPGQRVNIAVDALEDVMLTGVVEKIAPLGNTQTSVTTYDVYVQLTGEIDSRVLGGMNVTGEIVISGAENALTIPTEALKREDARWCVTMADGEVRMVEIGVMTDEKVQILSGLSEGERVVYGENR